MSAGYPTPTTEAVRCYWSLGCTMELWLTRRRDAEAQYGPEFDRWLAEHDRQVRADERTKIAEAIRAETTGHSPSRYFGRGLEWAAEIAEGH